MLEFSTLVIYFVLVFVVWFTYKVYIYPYYISPLRKIPGPPSESLLYGNFKPLFTEEAGEAHFKWVKTYGDVLKYHGLFNNPNIVVTNEKLIQNICLNQGYEFIKPKGMLGDLLPLVEQGIAFAEGKVHKRQRKMMNPAFNYNSLKNMVPIFSRVALKLKDLLEDKVNKGESKIILTPYISKATLDIIGIVGFNYEFNSLTSQSELAEAYNTIEGGEEISILRIIISILSFYVPFLRKIPLETNKKFNNACKVTERESEKLMKERNREDKNRNDLLSLLCYNNETLPDNEKMTEVELKYQIMTFLLAGHATTSTSSSWALYLLAQHPHEQDLLRQELVKAFPDRSKFNPTFDEINSLEYLNCIIKETLRLFPPVATLQRCNIKDEVFGEYLIPKNTTIDIPIVMLHRSPSIWGPTVDNFDPKRWLNPSLIENVTNCNYMPFGIGVRSCIGNKLALIELKVILSMFVRNFVFQPVDGLRMKRKAGFISGKPNSHIELIVSKVEV